MWCYLLLLLWHVPGTQQDDAGYSLNSTFNLVKHLKSITASNTCGDDGPELYCLLTGTPLAPGLDYTYSRYPGEYIDGQYCNTCQPNQHTIGKTIDEDEDNWWQSSSLATITGFNQQMTIDLDLGQEYQVVYFVLKAANSPRPARWVLEKSTDYGKTYIPWQIYVPTDSDCELYYNISASHFPLTFLSDDQVLCTSYYSTLNPLENGQIYTSLVVGRPGAEFFYLNESPRLQQWMKATNVRLRLEQMQILHNLINEADDTANRRFFYSIREIIIAGRCSCNGHAQHCTKMPDHSVQCECKGNTCGANCNTCCQGYNVFPWQPSSSGQRYQCEKCQCFGHSPDCHYDESAEGRSVDTEGEVNGGAVCTDCQDNTEGLNCERCVEGYYRSERESLYDKTCRECDCNLANSELVNGTEFGSCDQEEAGHCYCKEQFGGRRCDECRADHYNAVSVGLSCSSCDCEVEGTVSQLQNCMDMSGMCFCKDNVIGEKCTVCRDETYNITIDNDYGCSDCACNPGGSQNNNCDKETGQCACKAGLDGQQCNQVAHKHYVPGPDYLSLEAEDGEMRGRQALYDFNDGVFKDGFSGKGYTTLNNNVPRVDMDVEIPRYTVYKVDISYQLEDSFQNYAGYITATNKDTGEVQELEATLDKCVDGCNVTLQRCVEEVCEDVYLPLTPGTWTISFSYNAPAFNLDRVVLTPRDFEEPYIAQTDVGSCTMESQVMCNEYQLPNLEPYIHKTEASTAELDDNTTTFTVEDGGKHSLVIDFLYNSSTIDDLTLTVKDDTAEKTGYVTLHHCDELQMCRAIVRDEDGQPLIYDSVPGQLNVTFNEDIPNPIEGKMYLVVNTDEVIYALKPQYICMTGADGICTVNEFPQAHPHITRDGSKGYLVDEDRNQISDVEDYIEPRTNYDTLTKICGSLDVNYEVRLNLPNNPNEYRVIFEYFYLGLQDFSVTVHFYDNTTAQVGQGVISFSPCNGYSVCRTMAMNMDELSIYHTTPFFSFEPRYVLAKLDDVPVGKCILLNEIVTTVSQSQSQALVSPLPLVRTDEFVANCTPDSTDEFCRTGYLTIAAQFYSGLPECACNPDGSLSEVCEVYGGQCTCKPDVVGQNCDRCAAGYFNFPDCKLCAVARCNVVGSGWSSVCDEDSGECECAPNVIGEDCGLCDADSYDYDDVLGCRDCDCEMAGSADAGCSEEGQCTCKNNTITGDKCAECVEGRTNFPTCHPCGCDEAGSSGDICDIVTGQCPCKTSVTELLCDQCKYSTYNLNDNITAGCQDCFCFGVTDNCTSAAMAYYKVGREFEEGDSQGWVVIDSEAEIHNDSNSLRPLIEESTTYPGLYELAVLSSSLAISIKTSNFDWLAPYKGDMLYSYGGQLKFNMGYFPNEGQAATKAPRIEIAGSNVGIYRELRLPQVNSYTPYSITLDTGSWYSASNPGTEATITEIMTTLVNVKSIRIKGDLTDGLATYRLMSVSMDSAFPSNNGLAKITHLEQCTCPEGYTGHSCESCTEGYHRVSSSSLVLGECVPCDCNGHSSSCHVDTGVCAHCTDNTEGDHCDSCKEGYHGDASDGQSCQICPCPLPLASNSFGTCEYDPTTGGNPTCDCQDGYEGPNCGTCSSGYYGNPAVIGSTCSQCSTCNNNTDVADDYCDRVTGDCTVCLFDTAGEQCEHCADGFHGDALVDKDCAACECDGWGSVAGTFCDSSMGECSCLPNIEGNNCDQCNPGHWNDTFAGTFSDTECTSRDCAVALTSGPGHETKFIEVTYARSRGSKQRVTFFDSNGDMTEYIEIDDTAVSPSWRIGHDHDTCYFDKFFDASVFDDSDTVTLEITISERNIILYINGKEETGESYDRRTANTVSCNYEAQDVTAASFHSDVLLTGDVQYKSSIHGVGCTSCECHENGTVGDKCDTDTGQCDCHDEVQGYKCDMCKDDFYGLNTLGHCTACDCNEYGSNITDCNKDSGKCQCLDDITGQQCDICGEWPWAIITGSGCDECSDCTMILKVYMDELADKIGKTIRAKESGGRVSEDIEQLIDMKNNAIILKKEALDNVELITRYEGLWGTVYPVNSGSVKYQYNKLADWYDTNLLDKLEETEDLMRAEEEGIETVVSVTMEYTSTYDEIYEALQSSNQLVDNIRITAEDPDDVTKVTKRSKKKIKQMKAREIYSVKQKFIDGLDVLNSSVYADYGSLVGTDLTSMSGRISSLSDSMKGVLANAVDSVASPIDEFETTTDIVMGDLSNIKKTFETRKKALEAKISVLQQAMDEHSVFDLHNQIVEMETFKDEIFTSQAQDIIGERTEFVAETERIDMSSNTDGVEEKCRPLKLFMETPTNTPVQIVTELQSFNNVSTVISDSVSRLSTVADDATRSVNQWSDTSMTMKRDKLNTVTQMSESLQSQIPSLEGKVTTDDLVAVLAESQEENEELRRRLRNVEGQTRHQPRHKRYVSVNSVEGFTSASIELGEELKIQNKSNTMTQKIEERITASESKISELLDLSERNKQNIQKISSLLRDDGENWIDSKIDQLNSKQSLSLAEKMRELETKMEQIKQKMKATRDVASTVQVGVKMTDYSYLKLPMPLVAEQNSRYTGISMMIKTEEESGTLVYLGRRSSTDMVHLRLTEGRVQMKFDIGEGSTTVDTDVQVNDSNWHTIRVSRNGKFGYISIDSGNGNIKSFSGANGGSLDLLELDSDGYFFVGCSRETANDTAPEDMYKGSITQLHISNKRMGLWGYLESGGNLAATQALVQHSQFSEAPRNGLCMKGWGYAMYPCNGIHVKSDQPLTIDIKLQTYDRDGPLFSLYNVNTTESLDLYLVNGVPRILSPQAIYNPAGLDSEVVVSTNQQTTVSVEVSGLNATVSVDGVVATEYTLSSPLDWQDLDCKRVYIGGDNRTSLSGVIRSVTVDGIMFSLSQQDAEVYEGMAATCLTSKSLDGLTSFGTGYVRYDGVDFEQNFRVDIRIRTRLPYGVVFFASDVLGFNTISLSVDDGQVEFVAMRNYAKTAVRTGQDVSNGNWHDVSILREEDKITLNMDGYTSSTMLRENIVYPTSHGFWLTGIPYDMPQLLDVVPQLLPFEGALRSLSINGEPIDLNKFVEAEDVSLAGTSIRQSGKSYYTVQ